MPSEFEITSLRKTLRRYPWGVQGKWIKMPHTLRWLETPTEQIRPPLPAQTIVPHDPKLHAKLGMHEGEKLLVVAGSFGDWANALAKKSEVHFTDVSKGMVKYAKQRFPETRIRSFAVADAARWPAKLEVDRVFSFDPDPQKVVSFPLTILRAIGYAKKGLTMAASSGAAKEVMDRFGNYFAKTYGCRYSTSVKRINAGLTVSEIMRGLVGRSPLDRYASEEFSVAERARNFLGLKAPVWVFHFEPPADERLRGLAQTDFKVLVAVSDKKSVDLTRLSQQLEINERGIVGSLRRLHRFQTLRYPFKTLRETLQFSAHSMKSHKLAVRKKAGRLVAEAIA